MATALHSFSVPDEIESLLKRVRAYWLSLRRGEANMPFSDDVDPSEVPELGDQLMLITAFESPDRFRFEIVGAQIRRHYGEPLAGRFTDEVEQRPPLDSLTQQCAATVAQRKPTYFRIETSGLKTGYTRLLLPTWGDGHVMLLLGAVARL
ncbi:PAS domain-containing protein [Microvirga terricola]|uniref:PAS domain-containing protein n=1 Tax=Microvirga terricola TaxID=2719797 RepID=A0ABX0VD01_9HYPH|nr:PAS domain-containing protein [Microvirga terricola]NIX77542.1 PAS domain-containing protein [Microvirga terricola]